jgi:hypothetical protein
VSDPPDPDDLDELFARMRTLAERAGLEPEPAVEVVRGAVRRQVDAWERVRGRAEVPDRMRDLIDARLQTLPLARDAARP